MNKQVDPDSTGELLLLSNPNSSDAPENSTSHGRSPVAEERRDALIFLARACLFFGALLVLEQRLR
ncbi:MAG: hypothetical protein OXI87_12125 [Albidovulum sp.]|nr:hypothetical protein [Albidovulum sp.]MDE0305607.1 hypothetical protein [Albidovulum sp.]MDE0533671.1 hypothetical protein [Albidovulum sp.]